MSESEMKTALLFMRKGCSGNATSSPGIREHVILRTKDTKKADYMRSTAHRTTCCFHGFFHGSQIIVVCKAICLLAVFSKTLATTTHQQYWVHSFQSKPLEKRHPKFRRAHTKCSKHANIRCPQIFHSEKHCNNLVGTLCMPLYSNYY